MKDGLEKQRFVGYAHVVLLAYARGLTDIRTWSTGIRTWSTDIRTWSTDIRTWSY